MNTPRYIPSLDGIRAISALAVVFHHVHVPFADLGGLGVDVFFVLSGFLITRLLLADTGPLNLVHFWSRRIDRLVPALLLAVAGTLLLVGFLPGWVHHTGWSAFFALTYTTNIAEMLGFEMEALSHTWSLGVEMQFYLLWPFALLWLVKQERPELYLLVSWASLTAMFALLLNAGVDPHRLKSFHGSALLLGCLCAFRPTLPKGAGWLGVFMILAGVSPGLPIPMVVRAMLVQLGSAVLISSLGRGGLLNTALSWPPLTALGRISYGVYLWHFMLALITVSLFTWPIALALTLIGSISLSTLSYTLVEKPYLSRKRMRQLQLENA